MVLDFAKIEHFTTLAIVTMHYWRLLLLSLLAVSQPIASFNDRNLVNGRHQCSDITSLLRDSRLSLHGFGRKLFSEERRLNYRETRELNRENRQNEVRGDDSVRISVERRIVDIRAQEVRRNPEESSRFSRVQYQRSRDSQRLVDSTRFQVPEDRRNRYNHVSSRDLNKRELEDNKIRSLRELRSARQVRDVHRSIDVRDEKGIRNALTGIPIKARREERRIWDVGVPEGQTERRENSIGSQRARDEVIRDDASIKRESSQLREHRLYRTDRDIRISERRSISQRNTGNVGNARQSSRIQSQKDIRTVNRDEKRHTSDRYDIRGLDRSVSNFAHNEIQERTYLRSRRFVALRDINSRQSHSLERNLDNRQESRRSNERESLYYNRDATKIETSTRLNERESRSSNLDKKSFPTEHYTQRSQSRDMKNHARTFERTNRRSISERALSRNNENDIRELRQTRQTSDDSKSMRIRDSSRNTKRKESRVNEDREINRHIPESKHRSANVDTRRDKSRITIERIREQAEMEQRKHRSLVHRSKVRSNVRHQANADDRVTDIRDKRFEFKRGNFKYTIQERRSHEHMLRDNRMNFDQRSSRNGEVRIVKFVKNRVNTRIIRDNVKDTEVRENRSNKRYNRELSDRFAPSADNWAAILEATRVGSKGSPDRRSNDRSASIRDNREEMSLSSRVQSQDKRPETRNVKKFALKRENLALTRNRNILNLDKGNERVGIMESFKLNWHYLLYTLQAIYATSLLLKMFGSSEKNVRSQAFWMPTEKLLKVD